MTTDPSLTINERLWRLYERHRYLDLASVIYEYEPGPGRYRHVEDSSEPGPFAISVVTTDGEIYHIGDVDVSFAMQSISKVFTYGAALEDVGREAVLETVGVEPSGNAFDSITFDSQNRPFNPMVNPGAIAVADMVRRAESDGRLLEVMRTYAGNPSIGIDRRTYDAEFAYDDRNRAITYLMRSRGIISGDVEATLAVYLRQCSVWVTCDDVAIMAATLANGGVNPVTGERALQRRYVRDVLSVMYTCGMYDAAGQWAYDVGVPAKSGVSGGILCVIPGKMGIVVYSPGLDAYGNSVRGVRVLRDLSRRLGVHIFATDDEELLLGEAV